MDDTADSTATVNTAIGSVQTSAHAIFVTESSGQAGVSGLDVEMYIYIMDLIVAGASAYLYANYTASRHAFDGHSTEMAGM